MKATQIGEEEEEEYALPRPKKEPAAPDREPTIDPVEVPEPEKVG